MNNKGISDFIKKANQLALKDEPFLFILDFELNHPLLYSKNEIPDDLFYNINGNSNTFEVKEELNLALVKTPISYRTYLRKFKKVFAEILYGNTFLINLTDRIKLESTLSLKEIFNMSNAKYKLFYKDNFVVFSPESFIKIVNNRIYSFPMKGTIEGNSLEAKEALKSNEKELAEHFTIVDLIRNDLSMVARDVRVDKFRYFEQIKSNDKDLWQTSSQISGKLPAGFKKNLGDIIIKLLPAGSISGAPKKKTIEIIEQVESGKRGYYTGVMGWFDGNNLDSGVMIRFIEKKNDNLIYRSGCGITHLSKAKDEYQEMLDKVYVPLS